MIITEEHGSFPQVELSPQMQTRLAAANAKARAECFKLSTMMYERLPKELRDLIYSFLCLDDRQIPVGPYYHFRKYEPRVEDAQVTFSNTEYFPRSGDLETELSDGKVRIDHDIHPQADLLLPSNYIFDPAYMRREALLEALKVYYESNSFSVCNIEGGLDGLCTAVRLSDESTTDLVPIDHIRDLQIRVKFEHLHGDAISFDAHPSYWLEEFVKQEQLLRETVDSLQAFRLKLLTTPPHELNVEIVIMSDISRFVNGGMSDRRAALKQGLITNLIQTVRNMVYELLHDHSYTTLRVTHQDDELFPIPKLYTTKFFSLTKEEWNFEKSRQQPNRDWSQDFWIIPLSGTEIDDLDIPKLGGYGYDTVGDMATQRWSIGELPRPLLENPYWPIGSPFDREAAQAYLRRRDDRNLDGQV